MLVSATVGNDGNGLKLRDGNWNIDGKKKPTRAAKQLAQNSRQSSARAAYPSTTSAAARNVASAEATNALTALVADACMPLNSVRQWCRWSFKLFHTMPTTRMQSKIKSGLGG